MCIFLWVTEREQLILPMLAGHYCTDLPRVLLPGTSFPLGAWGLDFSSASINAHLALWHRCPQCGGLWAGVPERGPRMWKRGVHQLLSFSGLLLCEKNLPLALPWLRWYFRRRRKLNKTLWHPSKAEKIHDFGRRGNDIHVSRVLSNLPVTPAWISSFIVSLSCWLAWQVLIIYLEGSQLLFYTRYSQLFKCIDASHRESIFDGSWYWYCTLAVYQCAKNSCLSHFLIRVIPFAVLDYNRFPSNVLALGGLHF